jgi:hypothetical protein
MKDEHPEDDNLSPEFWPTGLGSTKENFPDWWARARSFVPNVPQNVARQLHYRHAGLSPFTWLPLSRGVFDLQSWSREQVIGVRFDDEVHRPRSEQERRGAFLRKEHYGQRGWLARVMERRGTWPVPPIILDNREPPDCSRFRKLPRGQVLIEGHCRLAIARSLNAEHRLAENHCVWHLCARTRDELKIQCATGHELAQAPIRDRAQVAFGRAFRPRRLGSVEPDKPDIGLAPVNADRIAVENIDPSGCDWFGRSRAIGARQRDRGEDEGDDSGAHDRRS